MIEQNEKEDIKKSYENNVDKEFVYGELPKYSDIIKTIEKIKKQLEAVGE